MSIIHVHMNITYYIYDYVSNTLLRQTIYCVKQKTVSTLAYNMHVRLLNFPCRHAAVVSCFALCSTLFTGLASRLLFVFHFIIVYSCSAIY